MLNLSKSIKVAHFEKLANLSMLNGALGDRNDKQFFP